MPINMPESGAILCAETQQMCHPDVRRLSPPLEEDTGGESILAPRSERSQSQDDTGYVAAWHAEKLSKSG